MSRPSAREAWRQMRADGIGVGNAENLRTGGHIEALWTPPLKIGDGPPSRAGMIAMAEPGHRFSFRLHRAPEGWYVEGSDGGPWEECEGPIVDSGRAPWLARPKDLGERQ